MIIHGVTPTNDVSAVSAQQVAKRLGLKSFSTLKSFLYRSKKYIAYHEQHTDDEIELQRKSTSQLSTDTHMRIMMPLSTAWRLIKEAEAGKILVKAARV